MGWYAIHPISMLYSNAHFIGINEHQNICRIDRINFFTFLDSFSWTGSWRTAAFAHSPHSHYNLMKSTDGKYIMKMSSDFFLFIFFFVPLHWTMECVFLTRIFAFLFFVCALSHSIHRYLHSLTPFSAFLPSFLPVSLYTFDIHPIFIVIRINLNIFAYFIMLFFLSGFLKENFQRF